MNTSIFVKPAFASSSRCSKRKHAIGTTNCIGTIAARRPDQRFLEAHALCGCVAFENGSPPLFLLRARGTKGLIGGLYVSPRFPQPTSAGAARRNALLHARLPPSRIEAQLMPFGGPVDNPLRDQGFKLYTRQFMLLDLHKSNSEHAAGALRACAWTAGMIASSSRAQN